MSFFSDGDTSICNRHISFCRGMKFSKITFLRQTKHDDTCMFVRTYVHIHTYIPARNMNICICIYVCTHVHMYEKSIDTRYKCAVFNEFFFSTVSYSRFWEAGWSSSLQCNLMFS